MASRRIGIPTPIILLPSRPKPTTKSPSALDHRVGNTDSPVVQPHRHTITASVRFCILRYTWHLHAAECDKNGIMRRLGRNITFLHISCSLQYTLFAFPLSKAALSSWELHRSLMNMYSIFTPRVAFGQDENLPGAMH
jgi:hypothetical protein